MIWLVLVVATQVSSVCDATEIQRLRNDVAQYASFVPGRRTLVKLRAQRCYGVTHMATPLPLSARAKISSGFGPRASPFDRRRRQHHQGVDYTAAYGTPVRAVADSVVVAAGWHGGLGLRVVLRLLSSPDTEVIYGHLSRIDVEPGQIVERGRVTGLLGSSGASTGPHCHVEVHVGGRVIDPCSVLGCAR